jgi:hypothetical protein
MSIIVRVTKGNAVERDVVLTILDATYADARGERTAGSVLVDHPCARRECETCE